ncbi:hypothetical protein OsJ_21820 [Oryza sativa Japonica Group]|uniref:Uncharacterized protein n=1 Tax=Oryza sativa subsp. japonica TaxID=39947 RepID=B9FTY1_ORYSJ|nr:hypothetical protein OsJ_21820 [Oryza sativa Japonica Group]
MAPVVISDAVAATPPAAAPAGDPPAVTPTAAAVAPPASPGLSIELTIHAVLRHPMMIQADMALVTQYLILKTLLLVIELLRSLVLMTHLLTHFLILNTLLISLWGLQAVILVKINSIHLWTRFLILNTPLLVLLKWVFAQLPAGPNAGQHTIVRPPARARPLPPVALGRSRLPASARPVAPRPPPPRPIAQTPLESGDSTRHDSSPSWRCCGTAAVWRDTATPSLLVRVSAFFLIADADSLVGPLAGEAAMLAATTYSAAVVDYVVAEHRHHHQASSPPGTSDATTATSVRVTGGEALPRDLQEVHRLRRPPRGPSTSRGCYGRTTRCRCSRQGTTVWGQRGAGGRSV